MLEGEIGMGIKVKKELLLVYFIAFLLLLTILWYVSLTTGLVLQFTLNCNSLLPIDTTGEGA